MVFLFPPLKPPSPQISVAKVLIVCYCHDKRLRNFLARLFFTISIVVLMFVFLFKMAVFFLFLRNVLLPIEILKIKILEHFDPPSQHFFVHKAFSHSFFCRGKVVLCHLAEWHNENTWTNVQRRESLAFFVVTKDILNVPAGRSVKISEVEEHWE